MNDKKRILILLKILDQVLQDNQDAKKLHRKIYNNNCIEEGISFEQVLYILYIYLKLSE